MIYQLVKSDQAPQIRAALKREDDDAVVDFENGSCALKFRKKGINDGAVYASRIRCG